MEVEDVIELDSSDDEDKPPAPKKIKPLPNAMVHIPNKIRDVTINPVALNKNKLSRKLVTRMPDNIGTSVAVNAQQSKTNLRYLQKIAPQLLCRNIKTDKPLQIQNKLNNYPLKVMPRKPLRIGKLSSGVQGPRIHGPRLQGPSPVVINNLPSSITVTKTCGGNSTPCSEVIRNKIRVNKQVQNNKLAHFSKNIYPAGCIGEILTVELDDDETSQSTVANSSPQWYLRPEQQLIKNSLEHLNNSEPKVKEMIEITIEDSPVKHCSLGGTKNVSETLSITIEDSPVKVLNKPVDEAVLESDIEQDEPKSKQSKKKLDYPETDKCINKEVSIEIESGYVIQNESKKNEDREENPLASPIDEENGNIITNTLVTPIVDLEQENDISQIDDLAKNNNFVDTGNKVDEKESTGKEIEVSNVSNGEFHSIIQRFIDLCLELDNSEDMKTIIEKRIKTYSRQVPKEFVESEQFLDMVSTKIMLIKSGPSKIYLHIKDVVDELKLQRKRKKATPLVNENDPVEAMEDDTNKYDRKRRGQIRKLEKTLKKLERAINKLDEQEVDFDDDEDSVYLLNDRYKERYVRTYAKLCQLTNTKMLSEPRIVIESREGHPPGPAKKIEKWINKKVPIGTPLPFPDFHDVVNCVREANAEDRLRWTEAEIMDEARDLFTRCGKKLQRRRQENEWRLASSRITQDVDPAETDETLRKKLDENKAKACKKETDIFNKYTQKQNQLQLEATEIDDKEADKSPVESDDEIDDDSNSLEDSKKRKNRLLRLIDEKESRKKSVRNTEQLTVLENVREEESESATLPTVNNKDNIESVNDQDIIDFEKNKQIEEKMENETYIDRRNLVEKNIIANNDVNTCVEMKDNFNNEQILSENVEKIESDESVKEIDLSHETTAANLESNLDDDKHIYLICDDFYGDELNLLEKLNSGNEISSPDSSDYDDSPIAISDSLDSDSESEHFETYDIISIENSSCSETETSTVNNKESKCTLISNNAVTCDIIREVPNSHNKDTGKSGTIAVDDIIASDEEPENIVLAYSEDEEYPNKDKDDVKLDNDYFNLQDDSITIGETFVSIDNRERLGKDVELYNCERRKSKDVKSANDDFKFKGDEISKDENVNDTSFSKAFIDFVESQDSANRKLDFINLDNDFIKHKDDSMNMNKRPIAEIVNIDNAKLDTANYDEALSNIEEESATEKENLYSRSLEKVNLDGESFSGGTYEDNTRKEDTMNKNVNILIQKYAENDNNALLVSEKIIEQSINSDGNNKYTKCDDDVRTIDKKLKDVNTNEEQPQEDDLIIKSRNNDVEIKTDKIPIHIQTFVYNAVSGKSTNGAVEFNKCDRDCVLQRSHNLQGKPITMEASGEPITVKYSSELITLKANDESKTMEACGEPITLKSNEDSKTEEASGTLKVNGESKTVAASGTSMTLEPSQESKTTEASREPMKLEAGRETIGEPITMEPIRELKTTECNAEAMTLNAREESMLETSGVNNENVSSTTKCVSTAGEKSTNLEDTFNMVEMMLDKLFNPAT